MSASSHTKKGYLLFVAILAIGAVVLLMRGKAPGEEDLLGLVPPDSVAVMQVSDLPALGAGLEAASAGLGLEMRVGMFVRNLERQLGFDPFEPEALRRRGINPAGGAVVYSPPPGRFGVVVLQVRDRSTFESTLMDLLEARTGAGLGEDRDVDGVTVRVAESRGRPVAAWAYRGDAVLISAGADCVGRVAAGASAEASLLDQLWFERGLEAAGADDVDLFAWASGEGASRVARGSSEAVDALALGLRLRDDGLRARAWAGVDAPRRNALDPLKGSSDATDLLGLLDGDAMAAGRLRADLRVAWSMARLAGLPRHLEELSAQLTARGLRIDRDVLPLLEGTFLVDAGLAGRPDVAEIRRLDPRRLNPFLYLRTTVFAPLTDAEKAEALMPRVAQAVARAVHGRLEVVEIGGKEAYEIHYRLGKGMTFGVAGDMLVVAGGEGAYESALERLAGGGGAFGERLGNDSALQGLASEGAAALLMHVPNLVRTVEGMRADSFGGGPTGMMLQHMTDMFIEPIARLTVVLGTLSVDEYGLVATMEIGFEQPEAEEVSRR